MHPECTVLAVLERESSSLPSTDKVSSFPNSNTWAFQGNFIPNAFGILYYDQLHFLLQRDLLILELDPGYNKRSNTNCLKHLDT